MGLDNGWSAFFFRRASFGAVRVREERETRERERGWSDKRPEIIAEFSPPFHHPPIAGKSPRDSKLGDFPMHISANGFPKRNSFSYAWNSYFTTCLIQQFSSPRLKFCKAIVILILWLWHFFSFCSFILTSGFAVGSSSLKNVNYLKQNSQIWIYYVCKHPDEHFRNFSASRSGDRRVILCCSGTSCEDFEAAKLWKGSSGCFLPTDLFAILELQSPSYNLAEIPIFLWLYPTNPFTILKLQNPMHDVPEPHKICQSPDSKALKLWKGWSGRSTLFCFIWLIQQNFKECTRV